MFYDAADMDGDGDLDLVTASTSINYGLRWYENDGFARFTARLISAGGSDVKIADIDKDGDLDILFFNGKLSVLVNNGIAEFTEKVLIENIYGVSLSVADLDGDTDLDLVATVGSGGSSGTFALNRYENNGDCSFATATIDTGVGRNTLIADLNGDGALDILAAGFNWYRNLAPLPGDFNQDRVVDTADYVLYRKTQGSHVTSFSGADANGDGLIGPADLDTWRAHFGQTQPAEVGGTSINATQTSIAATIVDATSDTAPANFVEEMPLLARVYIDRDLSLGRLKTNAMRRMVLPGDAVAANEKLDASSREGALLAWLSVPHSIESPLAEDIGSYWNSKEDISQIKGSELNAIDEIFGRLASTRFHGF